MNSEDKQSKVISYYPFIKKIKYNVNIKIQNITKRFKVFDVLLSDKKIIKGN